MKNLKFMTDFYDFAQLSKNPADKFTLLKAPKVIWLTGLSGSGKSTLSELLVTLFSKNKILAINIDGDDLRQGINKDLGFSDEDRSENIRRASEIAKLFLKNGIIPICSFISPSEKIRSIAKNVIGKDLFIEIFIDCPLEVCESRDVKKHYKNARKGLIKSFTGIDSKYEVPINPDFKINTSVLSSEKCAEDIFKYIYSKL